MFTVLPAIDLTDGRLGVFTPNGPAPSGAFGGDPLAAARAFVAAGARMLHVVDMDQAFTGEPANEAVVSTILTEHPQVALQCSGGVRDRRTADRMLARGATRVVMGSGALADRDALGSTIEALGERVVIGIEVSEGRIRSRGRDPIDVELIESIGWLTAAGASGFVVTALTRVGAAIGPDVAVMKRVARSGVATLAAGGVGTIAHLRSLYSAGVAGVIVGEAAAAGTLDLADAFAWAAEHRRLPD